MTKEQFKKHKWKIGETVYYIHSEGWYGITLFSCIRAKVAEIEETVCRKDDIENDTFICLRVSDSSLLKGSTPYLHDNDYPILLCCCEDIFTNQKDVLRQYHKLNKQRRTLLNKKQYEKMIGQLNRYISIYQSVRDIIVKESKSIR